MPQQMKCVRSLLWCKNDFLFRWFGLVVSPQDPQNCSATPACILFCVEIIFTLWRIMMRTFSFIHSIFLSPSESVHVKTFSPMSVHPSDFVGPSRMTGYCQPKSLFVWTITSMYNGPFSRILMRRDHPGNRDWKQEWDVGLHCSQTKRPSDQNTEENV